MNGSDKRGARGVNSDLESPRSTNSDQREHADFGHGAKSQSGIIDSLLSHFRDKPSTTASITSRRTEGYGTHRITTSTERHNQKPQQNKKSQTSWFSSSLPWTKKKESIELRGVVQNQIESSAGSRNGDNCLSEVHNIVACNVN